MTDLWIPTVALPANMVMSHGLENQSWWLAEEFLAITPGRETVMARLGLAIVHLHQEGRRLRGTFPCRVRMAAAVDEAAQTEEAIS